MTSSEQNTTNVLIVGAGLAGLNAARILNEAGLNTIILERNNRIGGRLATIAMETGRADTGAQFFTVRTRRFQALVDEWLQSELSFTWSTGWSDGSTQRRTGQLHPRYAISGGMAQLAQHYAAGLDIRLNTEIAAAKPESGGWKVQRTNGIAYSAQALILTPPVPESLQILKAGGTALHNSDRLMLEAIQYAPCVCGVFRVDGESNLPDPGAVQRHGAPVPWIADNREKGISPEATVITVHASPAYSRDLWILPNAAIVNTLQADLGPYLPLGTQVLEATIIRWPYSMPTNPHDKPCVLAKALPPLVFAGDAFDGPRVEGAVLSGMAAGETIYRALTGGDGAKTK